MICVNRVPGTAKRESLVSAIASETKSSCLTIPRNLIPFEVQSVSHRFYRLFEKRKDCAVGFVGDDFNGKRPILSRNQSVNKRGEKDARPCAGIEDSHLLGECFTHRRHKPGYCGGCEELTDLSAAGPVCRIVEGFTNMIKRMQKFLLSYQFPGDGNNVVERVSLSDCHLLILHYLRNAARLQQLCSGDHKGAPISTAEAFTSQTHLSCKVRLHEE